MMLDFSIDRAYMLGREISVFSELPESLNADAIAKIVHDVDEVVAKVGVYDNLDQNQKKLFKSHMKEGAEIVFPNTFNKKDGASILLRLWSGCMWAAKSIALETRDGENTPQKRRSQFQNNIYPRCLEDNVFKMGVTAAKMFKKIRSDPISLEGIPKLITKELSYI